MQQELDQRGWASGIMWQSPRSSKMGRKKVLNEKKNVFSARNSFIYY